MNVSYTLPADASEIKVSVGIVVVVVHGWLAVVLLSTGQSVLR